MSDPVYGSGPPKSDTIKAYFDWPAKMFVTGVLCFGLSLNSFLVVDGGHEPWSWLTTLLACAGTILVPVGIFSAILNALKLATTLIRRNLNKP